MNRILVCIAALAYVTLQSGCIKCVTCRNECYDCGGSKPTCSTNFISNSSWESAKQTIVNSSGCSFTQPTESVKLCDDHIENITYLYERANYYCDN
jgi:hypothetical protein